MKASRNLIRSDGSYVANGALESKTQIKFHWNAPTQFSQVRIRGRAFIVRNVRPFFGPLCAVDLIEKIV